MKYTIQSGKYVLRNILYLLPLVILPALCLSVSTDGEAIVCLIETLLSGKPTDLHFIHIFRAISVLSFTSWKATIGGIMGIVALVVFGSLLMALIEKHMRIGKRTFNGVFSKLNDNLLPTLVYVLLLLGIYELWAILLSVLLFFFSNVKIAVLAYALMGLVYIAAHGVLIYGVGIIYLWLPCMQITGFKSSEALYYSNRLSSSVKWKIQFGQTVALLIAEIATCLCAMLASNALAFTLLMAVLYCVLIMVYCVRMEIAYFDLDNIERADLARYYQR